MAALRQARTRTRADRVRREASAPFFFGRQLALFMAISVAVIVLDLFLYIGIAVYENGADYQSASPKGITRDVAEALANNGDGTYSLPEGAAAWMDEGRCWAILISEDGDVVWNYRAPDEVIHPYRLAEAATFARVGYLEDYPCFIWQRDDGLLVTGFPKESYVMNLFNYLPQSSVARMPLYVMLIFFVDALVLFLVYAVSKRRVVRDVAPMMEAIDELARNRPVHVRLTGSLRAVGESINAASAVMRRKDEARKRWVTGVSHDVRTPLAISLGHAERIAADESLPEPARESARAIVQQSERIRDLVSDLNTASKLEYDMQPADVQPLRIARLVRSVAAGYADAYSDGRFAVEAAVAARAEDAIACVDERLVERALRNLADNAVRHNDGGCTVRLFADVEGGVARIGVEDDGKGIGPQALARLNREAEAIAHPDDEAPDAAGPVPPPHFADWRPGTAAELAAAGRMDPADCAADTPREDRAAAAEAREPKEASLAPKDLVGMNEHGLGLSLVARIAAAHGGSVEFAGGVDDGFKATMLLPASRAGASGGDGARRGPDPA